MGLLDNIKNVFINNREEEVNKDFYSVSDLEAMVDYVKKQREMSERELRELTTPPEQTGIFGDLDSAIESAIHEMKEGNSDYVVPDFLHNWKFTDFLKGRDYSMQTKITVNCETGETMAFLVLQDASDRLFYLAKVSYLEDLSVSEILKRKEELLVGITEYGNFWLHDDSKIFYMEAHDIY